MFCLHCGNEIADDAIVCVSCGKRVTPLQKVVSADSTGQWGSGVFALLVISVIIFPPLALVAGIIGLSSKPKRRQGIILLVGVAAWVALAIWMLMSEGSYTP